MTRVDSLSHRLLRAAARFSGIQPSYVSAEGKTVWCYGRGVQRLLELLHDRPFSSDQDLLDLIGDVREHFLKRGVSPVHVIWSGDPASFRIHLPEGHGPRLSATIELEQGDRRVLSWNLSGMTARPREAPSGTIYHRYDLRWGETLPIGYHRVVFDPGAEHGAIETFVFCAPSRSATDFSDETPRRDWGLFCPVHAIRSESDWGIGDLGGLARVVEGVQAMGGSWVGTLPLLATYFEGARSDPSPYSPITRLFWNEIFIDLNRIRPGVPLWTEAKHIRDELKRSDSVDYEAVYALKKQVLMEASRAFFAEGIHLGSDYRDFIDRNPEVVAYARFRAGGAADGTEVDAEELHYHLYAQFEFDRQVRDMRSGLYLDFPIGVHREGYDSTVYSEVFLKGAAAGAPPDPLFENGQNWGFYPFHPDRLRGSGYMYLRKALRAHCRLAKIVRIDHVMGLHRIYVVPDGLGAKEGAYLRFAIDEMCAVIMIEALRAECEAAGEDLGTVPTIVRERMDRHGIRRLWILQFEFEGGDPRRIIDRIPENSIVGLNTHDMPPFASFWQEMDLDLLLDLEVVTDERARELAVARARAKAAWITALRWDPQLPVQEVYLLWIDLLRRSRSKHLMINIEDVWQETNPQNVPGTWKEYPNWRRRLKYPLEEWLCDDEMVALIKRLGERTESA